MDTTNLKFISNVDGSITCEIYDSLGIKQDLTGCHVTFCLGREWEWDALISEEMTILDDGGAIINLTPEQTEVLDYGEYEINLIIVDTGNKKHATEKIKIIIDKIIE